ncbi:MAG: hypothetical protein PGN09_07760 [Sphingomonas fennica]
MPLRDGEAWNDGDLAQLRSLARAGQPLHLIARALERAPAAVAVRAKRLKVTIRSDWSLAREQKPPERTVHGWRYRVTVFGQPRAPWRDEAQHAKQDAIDLGLASWDADKREWFIAVPTDIEVDTGVGDRRDGS